MERREFIRLSLLSMLAGSMLSLDVEKQIEIKQKRCISFKVSQEFLEDKIAFDAEISRHNIHGNLTKILIGYDEDDFIHNIQTCVIEFTE